VMSAVIRLRPRPFPKVATDPALLARLLKLGFGSKRKMLRNNLSALIERSQLLELLATLEIAENVRAEDLSVSDWVALSNKMLEEGYSS
jgi:16S rRNA (adenine1518-N6/adenine1519-N6)-dimethyltransferase